MKIKRYVAENMQEAMLKVKGDLGEEAVILHTRKFRKGGIFGFFAREMVEITAATEVRTPYSVSPGKQQEPVQQTAAAVDYAAIIKQEQKPAAMNEPVFPIPPRNPYQEQAVKKAPAHVQQDLFLQELQEAYFVLLEIYDQLIDNDVSEAVAKQILQKIIGQLEEAQLNDVNIVKEAMQQQILQILQEPQPIKVGKSIKIIALVGPTGVGKTTTIAKLAAEFALNQQHNIALITADTYRIAAIEQLKTYGEIIGVNVEPVYTQQELREAIARNLDKELIFVDTAGRSQKNARQLSELDNLLSLDIPIEKYLVLSATTKYRDMCEIIRNFEQKDLKRIIFTKLDETNSFGSILNIINDTHKSLSYITTGQNVPEDIEVADPQKIAKMIVKGS